MEPIKPGDVVMSIVATLAWLGCVALSAWGG